MDTTTNLNFHPLTNEDAQKLVVGHLIRHGDGDSLATALVANALTPDDFADPQFAEMFRIGKDWFSKNQKPLTLGDVGAIYGAQSAEGSLQHLAQAKWSECLGCRTARHWVSAEASIQYMKEKVAPRARRERTRNEDARKFPADSLPEEARRAVATTARAAQLPADLVANWCLWALSAIVARNGTVCEWLKGLRETPNLYGIALAAPSEHKSSALGILSPVLSRLEKNEKEAWVAKKREVEAKRAVMEARFEEAKKKRDVVGMANAKAELEANPLPPEPRLLVDDITPESLARRLQGNGCLLFCGAEAQVKVNMLDRYNNPQNHTPYLKCWSGDPMVIDRAGAESINLERPLLAIACMIQPKAVIQLAREVRGARELGLLSRFLFAWPMSGVGTRDQNPHDIDADAIADWDRLCTRLWRSSGRTLSLSADAQALLTAWAEKLEKEMGEKGRLFPVADWVGKVQKGQVVRLATVLHEADGNESTVIGEATMRRALALGRYYLAHALFVFDALESSALEELAAAIAKYAEGQEEVSYKKLKTSLRAARKAKRMDIMEALDLLEAQGVLKALFNKEGQPTGRWNPTGMKFTATEDQSPTLRWICAELDIPSWKTPSSSLDGCQGCQRLTGGVNQQEHTEDQSVYRDISSSPSMVDKLSPTTPSSPTGMDASVDSSSKELTTCQPFGQGLEDQRLVGCQGVTTTVNRDNSALEGQSGSWTQTAPTPMPEPTDDVWAAELSAIKTKVAGMSQDQKDRTWNAMKSYGLAKGDLNLALQHFGSRSAVLVAFKAALKHSIQPNSDGLAVQLAPQSMPVQAEDEPMF